MQYEVIFLGLTFAVAVIALVISVGTFLSLNKLRGHWELAVMFLLQFVYAFAYALELVSETIELKILFNHVQYLAIPLISVGWLFLANRFRNPEFKANIRLIALFLVIPILTILSVQISYYTPFDLYYSYSLIDTTYTFFGRSLPVLVFGKGPLYYLAASYNMAMIFLAAYIYYRTYRTTSGVHKQQALFLMICSVIAASAPVMTFFSGETSGIDTAIYIVAILSYIIYYSMLKYEYLYLKPSAYLAAFETASESIYLFDDKLELISWNNAVTNDGISGTKLQYHMRIDDLFENSEIIDAVRDGLPYGFNAKGKHYVIETIAITTTKGKKNGYIVKFNDMTSYIERIERLDYQASHDELTDILNRRAFLEGACEHIQNATIAKSDFAVMMIDLDDFKHVNDTYGHPSGDIVLKSVAEAICGAVGEGDLVGRYGGEEFVVLVKQSDAKRTAEIAERIRTNVMKLKFAFNGAEIGIQVSIGVALSYHDHPLDILEYIKNADDALYVSKRKGKNKATIV